MRLSRVFFALWLVLLGGAHAFANEAIEVTATSLPIFDRSRPNEHASQRLTYLGGLNLRSSHGEFRALSGLDILADRNGEHLVIVTDEMHWLTARLETDASGAPLGLFDARIGPLVDNQNRAFRSKRFADFEGVTLADQNGQLKALAIAESNQPIRSYTVEKGVFRGPAKTPWGGLPPIPHGRADGPEAIVYVTKGPLSGSTVIFLEDALRSPTARNAVRILSDGTRVPFEIRRLDGFSITGADMLPNGDLVIVERFFTWQYGVAMRIRLLPASDIAAGAVQGEILIESDGATIIDNMEGIAVTEHAAGPILTIISDDNGNFFQRTLLLRFQLRPDQGTATTSLSPPSPSPRPLL
ncbi:MAG: esterase-like activity of phytase family protein [Pseudomonadota bacterium]